MSHAKFQPAGWMPSAVTDALDRIEKAAFDLELPPVEMRREMRAALRMARDGLTDANATYHAQIVALNRALKLST